MCYNAVQLQRKILKDAKHRKASQEEINEIIKRIEELETAGAGDYKDYYHAKAFDHPKLRMYTLHNDELQITKHHWGLIPSWLTNPDEAKTRMAKNTIARGETMFELESFRDAAAKSRCIIPFDGFYEHYHKNNKKYPHLIQNRTKDVLLVGGLTSKYFHPKIGKEINTFSIVTTEANEYMREIHNNPKREDSRMPLLLNNEDVETWLKGDEKQVKKLVKPNREIELTSYTVRPLNGNKYIGNVPEIMEEYIYPDLMGQGELF